MSPKKTLYQCNYENCTASFARPNRLEIHIRKHTGECPFICEYEACHKSYKSLSHLKRHEAASHEKSFKCTIEGCSEVLKTKDTLRKHIDNFHHKKKPKLYKCTECDKEFNKHTWLRNHMFKHTGILPYKCPIEGCEKRFLFPSKLKRHMKVHKGHKCKIPGCEEVFKKWSLYVSHIKEFHPSVYTCSTCNKVFSSTSNLKAHAAVHSLNRKVFSCEMPNCTRFYYQERNLKWHMKSYHEARPHVCDKDLCHRAFKTQDALDEHKSLHTRRKQRKKKKPRPAFAAILSGCADPRKFIMPPKRIKLESSDDSSSDGEVSYQDTSAGERSHKTSQSEVEDSEIDINGLSPSSAPQDCDRIKLETSDVDFSEEESHNKGILQQDTIKEELVENVQLITTNASKLDENFNLKLPNEREPGKDFSMKEEASLISEDTAVGSNNPASSISLNSIENTCLDESSSEYESTTVSILGHYDKYSTDGDDTSFCLSEAEDMLNYCEGAFEARE